MSERGNSPRCGVVGLLVRGAASRLRCARRGRRSRCTHTGGRPGWTYVFGPVKALVSNVGHSVLDQETHDLHRDRARRGKRATTETEPSDEHSFECRQRGDTGQRVRRDSCTRQERVAADLRTAARAVTGATAIPGPPDACPGPRGLRQDDVARAVQRRSTEPDRLAPNRSSRRRSGPLHHQTRP